MEDLKTQPKHCQLYIKRKSRHCRAPVTEDRKYCVEHSHLEQDITEKRKRIPCPFDPKHTVYEDKLKQHLLKCNSREFDAPIYMMKGINRGGADDGEGSEGKVALASADVEEVMKLIEVLRRLDQEHQFSNIKDASHWSHDLFSSALLRPDIGSSTYKHLRQQSALLACLSESGLLGPKPRNYVEFGAGRGGLAHWIQRGLLSTAQDQVDFVLVDMQTLRHKFDAQHKDGPKFTRLRLNIADLDLSKVSVLQDTKRPICAVSKHLCGDATDLTLRCLRTNTPREVQEPPVKRVCLKSKETSDKADIDAVLIALCCHHKCTWSEYCGREWLSKLGITRRQFPLLTSMSSWATCRARADRETTKEEGHEKEVGEEEPYWHNRYGSLTPENREEIGLLCKRLIDWGRVCYVREVLDFPSAHLCYYVTRDVSLENVALVAFRTSQIQESTND